MAITKTIIIEVKDGGVIEASEKVNKLNNSLNTLESTNNDVNESITVVEKSHEKYSGAIRKSSYLSEELNKKTGGLFHSFLDLTQGVSIATRVQNAYSFVIGVSTGAMKAFKIALIGMGIGAIVVGILMLVANFDKLKTAVMNLIPGLATVGEFFGKIINAVTDFIGFTSEAERAMNKLAETTNKALQNQKDYLESYGDTLTDIQKKHNDLTLAYLEKRKEINEREGLLDEEKNKKLIEIENRYIRERDKIDSDDAEKAAEKRKAEREKIAAENEREQKKQLAIEAEARKLRQEKLNNLQDLFDKNKKDKKNEDKKKDEEERKEADNLILATLEGTLITAKQKALDEIEFEKNKNDAIAFSRQNLNNIMQGLEATGLAKTKAGQIISKAVALTQIGIDSAIAISKASTLANAEGVAAQLAFPMVPGIGTVARIVSYASTAMSVAANMARAKQLLSSGGSGGGSAGSAPSIGGGGSAPAPPQFNIVGQNTNNQLAQSIGRQQSLPIEAYVVSGAVTSAQAMDRNRVKTATFN